MTQCNAEFKTPEDEIYYCILEKEHEGRHEIMEGKTRRHPPGMIAKDPQR